MVWIALFVFSLLLQSVTLAAPSSALAASGLLADTVQGFEVDGDLKSGDAATTPATCPAATSGPVCIPEALVNNPPMTDGDDWLQGASQNGVASASGTSTPTTFLYQDATDPGDTSAYGGGNKEDDTRDWVYVNSAGPNPKTDFKHVMAHVRPNAAGDSAIAYLGAERIVNNGTMVVDFELNQKAFKQFSVGPAKPNRTDGDLLISLKYSNGGANPIVTLYTITNVKNFPEGQTNDFVKVSDATTIDAVRSATNFVDMTSSGFGYTIPSFDFAEASIDLKALGIENGCPGFSSGHIRSRTGGDPASSQLKDAAPQFPIDLNNCGKVTVIKDAVPNSAQDFDFTTTGGSSLSDFKLDDDNNVDLSDTKNFNLVVPGDYTITEAAVAGWKLTDLVCPGETVSIANRKATINVGPNEHVTCTFTNTKLGKVILEKQTSPDGATGDFVFTSSDLDGLAGTLQDNGQIVVDNVTPGVYHATEADPTPGFDLGSIVCDDPTSNSEGDVPSRVATFRVGPGETVKCTFTNVQRGTITIIKDANPNDPQDFAFTTTGSGLSSFSLDDDADNTLSNTKTFTDVKPGTYSVTETDASGWELTGLVCNGSNGSTGVKSGSTANIDLKAGGSVTCTYTNTKAGHIVVDKITDPSGDLAIFEFNPSWSATNFFLADAGTPVNSGELKFGTYSVVELAKEGWDLTSATCTGVNNTPESINLQPGQTVTCTFTNAKRGHILIDKVTDPSGDAQLFTFTPSYNNNQTFQLADATTPNDSGALVHGTYSVSEATVTGWTQTGATCDDGSPVTAISLQAGETVTCTFTNTKRGTIIVEKQTSPDGATGTFTFTGDAAGSIGDNGRITVSNLVPGTYTSTEGDPGANFDLGAIVCDDTGSATVSTIDLAKATATFKLDPGETVTCVFTNVQRGTITIIKNAQPDDAQDFAYTTSGSGLSGFSLDDDGNDANTLSNTKVFQNLPAGSYSVTEAAVAGWDLTSIDCNALSGSSAQVNGATANLTLAEGGSIVCVYVNSKPSIQVVKTAGAAADGEVFTTEPGNVTYTYVVRNTGPLPLQNVTVTDDNGTLVAGDDFAVTCPKTTLAVGESMTCTATIVVSVGKTNVATARGFTAKGTSVEDTDNAVVKILTHGLVISKSNNAPIETLDLPDGTTADLPTAKEGSTVTYTLHYTFSGDPVTNGVITDVLPLGLTYKPGSATNSAEFTFVNYDNTTRTLTWTASTVTASGTVTYQVTVDKGASERPQPLENVATIKSDQTPADHDTSDVFVPVIPLAETNIPTPPPTDLAPSVPSNPGSGMALLLAVLGLFVLGIAFVTPAPAVIRRRNRR